MYLEQPEQLQLLLKQLQLLIRVLLNWQLPVKLLQEATQLELLHQQVYKQL